MRRWRLRRLVALNSGVRGVRGVRRAETHLQYLLCAHADRWAAPPELPKHIGASVATSTVITPLTAAAPRRPS
jgi:hypothetical protein